MGGVKFNSGVRYSQWAINSRLYDFKESTNNCGFDLYDKDGKLTKAAPKWKKYDTGLTKRFHYVPGLVAKAILESADFYKGFDWSKPWFYSAQAYAQEVTYNNNTSAPTLDAMNAVKMYFPILSSSLKSSEIESKANTAISKLATDLKNYNDNFSIGGKNSSLKETNANDTQKGMIGGWFHKSTDYVDQMWLDGAYMGSATLAQLAEYYKGNTNIFGSTSADWDMVTKQLNIVWDNCWDSNKQLMYHAFSATGDAKAKSDGTATWAGLSKTAPVYHSAAFWGRANAWYLYALVDALEAMKNCDQGNTENYTTLKTHLEAQAAGILKWQDQQTGGWYQIMDENNTYTANSYSGETWTSSSYNNYIETSASTIFAAALFKAVRLGLLGDSYKAAAKKAFEGIVENFVVQDPNNGTINIWSSSLSAGLGGKSYRDGSNEYYILGKDTKRVLKEDNYTEGKVLGGFIMAATEYERAYQNQNQDSKQILFAKDLAPSYTFTTTEGKLDATAYGNGTITYQWYKDGSAIADAKSATYTPTEGGSYYCIATDNSRSAGSNTIQTSTTKVTTANTNTDNGSTDNNGGSDNGNTGTTEILSATVVAGKTLNVATKTSNQLTADYITIEGGTATLYNGHKTKNADMITSKDGINLSGSNASYMKITLEKPLAKGDVITATSSTSLYLTKDATRATNIDLNSNPYTIPEGSNLIGAKEFYLWNGKFKAIKITRANTQVALTASFSPATISATEGDVAQNLPTLTVKAGETTLTAKDYTVTYASDNNAVAKVENGKVTIVGEGETNIVATIKPKETNKYKEISATFAVKVEKKQTPVDPTESGVIYDFTTSVGTTSYGTSCTSTNGIITFSSNFSAKDGKYITIKPKTGGFKAGDVITLEGYCDSKNLSGVIIYSDVNGGNSIFKSNILAKSADGGSKFTYTIEKDCNALYLGRYGGGTTRLTSLKVERSASSSNKTRLTASFKRNADVVVNTTKNVTLPTLTVQAGNTTLSADQYTVVYTSNAEDVATLSGNTITINNLGIATITATVTPKDANTYEGTTATYQLSVKAPSPLIVSVMDVTINTTDAEEEQPVIKVYGDNDKLLKLGQEYTLSFAVSGDKNVTVDNTTGKFSVTKNAGKFINGTSLITVTATPRELLGSNYIAGTLQFSYSVSEGKIKPVFSDSFKDITINLQPGKSKTIAVPLIYNGEDVSSYFTYTYTIDPVISGLTVDGSKLTFTTPSATGTYTVKVNADAATIGDVNYGDVYDKPSEISFTLNVDSKYKPIIVTPDPKYIEMHAGTTQVAPDLTVTKGTTTLDDTEYNVTWFSTSPGVVKVDATTGKIEAVSEGTANIRVVVTGENLESTTALITVKVDDRAVYRVKGSGETYKNHTRMWNQDKNMSVVLGGWLFSDDVKEIVETPNTSSEGLSAKYHWGPGATKAKWKLTGFDYYVAGDNNKNARQENGSNALPETTKIYNAYFADKGTIKDNMFNVPCSGSYLEFNPVTNGKVTVHIFQNGVFDAKTTKNADGTTKKEYQYRPQRRVFVMDEAGNFVESTAHIESTNGKPTGGIQTIDKYTWDLDSKTLTIGDVRSHFKDIPTTFDMTADAFKNNVYESLLDTQKVPNAAANDRKGSHGWSVLADSPVTYTFNVKAGKTYYLYNFGSKIGFYGFSFDEGDTKPTVDLVNYDADDATANNEVVKTAEGHVAQVKIARKMVANRWTTCVLPFSLNRQQVDAIFGPAYSAISEEAKNGTQILYFDHVEGSKAYFVRHAYNTIVAGKPFLIKPTKEVTSINTADVKDYPYVTIENTEPAKWCESNGYVWTSSYNTMNIVKNDYFIGASDGKFKAYSGTSGTVKGFRGFLKADHSAGTKPMMLSISTSSITDGNEGETTGIEDLIINADGELIPANCRVYNINGQLVSEDANSFQSLPSGIYIINGKKYIK